MHMYETDRVEMQFLHSEGENILKCPIQVKILQLFQDFTHVKQILKNSQHRVSVNNDAIPERFKEPNKLRK